MPRHIFGRAVYSFETEAVYRAILMEIFTRCKRNFVWCYYAIDVTALVGPLLEYTQAIPPGFERPVQGRWVMDEGYSLGRQATNQLDCAQQFLHAGASVRILKPVGAGFAIMHTKSTIIDDGIFVSGGLNLT